jgi:uncharacterized YccA/Bax inhibitor family protein
MTVESTLVKTGSLFVILVLAAAVGWLVPVLSVPALVIALVLGLVNSFKKSPSVPLIVLYSVFEGLGIGGFSAIAERLYPGVVIQAVLATLVTVGVVLALFASGRVRSSPRLTKVFLVAMVSYAAFSLLNFALSVTGVTNQPFGLYSSTIFGIPIGILIGIFAVLMASYSLVLDFEFVKNGVNNRIDSKYEWTAGFGILVTVVWLYIEFVRIFALRR